MGINRVVHFEIMAADLDRAQKFYEQALGWKFQSMGEAYGGYRVIITGPRPDEMAGKPMKVEEIGINGGLMKRSAPLPPDGMSPNAFTAIIGVLNIDEAIAKIDAAGGAPQTDKMDVEGVGKIRYYKDTEGNIFGIIEPEPMN